jgi:hypothetical protein
MTSKSKAKGGAWERDVANFLTETYASPFMRVPNSGAYTGGKNAIRKSVMSDGQIRHMKGDIVPPDNWNHFNCECKNYASFPFHRLLFNDRIPQLEDWLAQIRDAADVGDVNILFMKITRVGKFVAFETSQNFLTNRSVNYIDDATWEWRITEFDSFFNLNRAEFEKAHI